MCHRKYRGFFASFDLHVQVKVCIFVVAAASFFHFLIIFLRAGSKRLDEVCLKFELRRNKQLKVMVNALAMNIVYL